MKLLLDTHIFLWYITGNSRLPDVVRAMIRGQAAEVYLSVVSFWEIVVKHQIGKLPLPRPPDIYLPEKRKQHQIESLPLDEASVTRAAELPLLHRDPFDRMLVCQAIEHSLTLVSVDAAMQAYAGHVSILS